MTAPGVRRPLTVYYRVTPRSNDKGRPPWYSKRLALQSMLVSLEDCGTPYSVVYVADGGVPADLAPVVERTGEVVTISGGSAAKALRRLVDLLQQSPPGPGLLWLAEDDYLYRPEAFTRLVQAYAALPQAGYFNLYTPDNRAWHATHPSQPAQRGPEDEQLVDGVRWHRVYDTNASFGIRRELVSADARLLKAGSFSGAGWDHTMLLLTNGLRPFSWRHLLSDLYLAPNARSIAKAAVRPVVRTSLNLLQATTHRSRPGHAWYAPVEDLSTHVEVGYLSPHWDSQGYAEQLSARLGDGIDLGGTR